MADNLYAANEDSQMRAIRSQSMTEALARHVLHYFHYCYIVAVEDAQTDLDRNSFGWNNQYLGWVGRWSYLMAAELIDAGYMVSN